MCGRIMCCFQIFYFGILFFVLGSFIFWLIFLPKEVEFKVTDAIGSTDAAPEVPHPCLTRRRAGDAVARAFDRVVPRGSHVVFTDLCQREPTWIRLGPIRPNSGLNRPYRLKRPKLKKKKKKRENAPFDLILTLLQPSFTHGMFQFQSCELCLIYENHVFSYYLLLLLNLVYVCIM